MRRVLRGDELPSISPVVDAYNLASTRTIIPISGFDLDLLKPPLHVRFSGQNDTFKGIGMTKPMTLARNMLVVTDTEEVVCVYPHRDADATKITPRTRNVIMIAYGAPGIPEGQLKEAVETTLSYVQQVAKGTIESVKVFRATRQ